MPIKKYDCGCELNIVFISSHSLKGGRKLCDKHKKYNLLMEEDIVKAVDILETLSLPLKNNSDCWRCNN